MKLYHGKRIMVLGMHKKELQKQSRNQSNESNKAKLKQEHENTKKVHLDETME